MDILPLLRGFWWGVWRVFGKPGGGILDCLFGDIRGGSGVKRVLRRGK